MPSPFIRIILAGTNKTHNGRAFNVFCRVEFDGARLSITGVEGPMHNGNAHGGCGQIRDALRDPGFTPAPAWV